MIVFRIALPARIGLATELALALMLIVLGLRSLGLFSWRAGLVKVRHGHFAKNPFSCGTQKPLRVLRTEVS